MAWTRWSLTLLCCCAAHAWAGDAWCRAGGTPALAFEWVPKDKAEPSVGSVRVKDAYGKVVQVLDGLETIITTPAPSAPTWISITTGART